MPNSISLFAIAFICSLYSAAVATMLLDAARPVITIYNVGFALAVMGATASIFYFTRSRQEGNEPFP